MQVVTLERSTGIPAGADVDEPRELELCACGAPLYAGTCMEVGACERADSAATIGAARTSAKYQPAAWTVRGGVD